MIVIVSFLVKLSFGIGHESPRKELNGWVHMEVACVHQELEFMCAFKE
jgi:hypothetical protein